jgi:NAD(P)-dependent dehydrogenase (short-subunit alcohol dehydrogenase family)
MKALVTGASSGIGRAICDQLLAGGWEVVGLARDFSRFPCDQARFVRHAVDLEDLDPLPDRLRELAGRHPRLDALICNAGQGRFGMLEEFSYAQIRRLVDLDFTSHAYVVRAFLPLLKRAGSGDIVFMGSEAALRGSQKGAIYCAAKFALRGFAQALREECARAGIRVTLVNPGMVKTPFFEPLDFRPGEDPDNYILPEDVARIVAHVLAARPGTVFDEINLSPRRRVIEFGRRDQGSEAS